MSYPWLKPLSSIPFRDHTSRQRSSSTGHLNRGGLGKSILGILRVQRLSPSTLAYFLFCIAILKSFVFLATFWPIFFYKALSYRTFDFAYLAYFAVKIPSVPHPVLSVYSEVFCGLFLVLVAYGLTPLAPVRRSAAEAIPSPPPGGEGQGEVASSAMHHPAMESENAEPALAN